MMTDDDILRAAAGLRAILDERFPNDVYRAVEMSDGNKQSARVPTETQVGHLKYELEQIPKFLDIGTQGKRHQAFRWLSDVGGVMRSELHLISLTTLRDLFRPEADRNLEANQLALLPAM